MLDLEAFSLKNAITEKRDLERNGTRYLITEMLKNRPFNLCYDAINKPYLEGGEEKISISHSHKWLLVTLNKNCEAGVDIELVKEKILNIRTKFLSEEELNFAGNNLELLTILWAAKEAIYKANGKRGVEFSSHISIKPFEDANEGIINGKIENKEAVKNFHLFFRKQLPYVLALVVNEN